jgi:N-carbamoylputrescine amidase
VFVAAVNRVGLEPSSAGSIEFWGHSFVCGPDGALRAEAGLGSEVLVLECELLENQEQRRTWPFFRDRRVDAYGDLSKRWTE